MFSIRSGMKPHKKELHLRIFAIDNPKTLSILNSVISVYENLVGLIFHGRVLPFNPNGLKESNDSHKES